MYLQLVTEDCSHAPGPENTDGEARHPGPKPVVQDDDPRWDEKRTATRTLQWDPWSQQDADKQTFFHILHAVGLCDQSNQVSYNHQSTWFDDGQGTVLTWYPKQRGKLKVYARTPDDLEPLLCSLGSYIGDYIPGQPPNKKQRLQETKIEEVVDTPCQIPTLSQYKSWVTSIIRRYQPEELNNVDALMAQYSGREAQLMEELMVMHFAAGSSSSSVSPLPVPQLGASTCSSGDACTGTPNDPVIEVKSSKFIGAYCYVCIQTLMSSLFESSDLVP